MPVNTNSGSGIYVGDNEDFGTGHIDPWGYILHSEAVSIELANVNSVYRQRNFTHTLSIKGVLLEKDGRGHDRPPILYLKDRLADYFYNNTVQAVSMGSGIFASVPTEGVVWEPVSLDFQEDTYTTSLKYTATLVYRKTPTASEIVTRVLTYNGVIVWDNSTVDEQISYDRNTRKITKTTSISGNIRCPNDMPWGSESTQGTALWFYNEIKTKISQDSDIRDSRFINQQVSKNYDQQTVTYNFSYYEVVDYSNIGFISPWGYISYSESISIDHSKVDSVWRRRGHTHTLNINGSLWRSNNGTTVHISDSEIKALKAQLSDHFYNNLPATISMTGALFAALPVGPSQATWEPVSLNFGDGNFVEELTYTATIVYRRHASSSEISARTVSYFGIELWDNSNISIRTSYDRITKKANEATNITGSIKCPDKMPWGNSTSRGTAKWFASQIETLRARVYSTGGSAIDDVISGITEVDVTENFDEQTITYTIAALNTKNLGDGGKKIRLFGLDWPALSDIQIQSSPLKDSHIAKQNNCLQNITLSFSVTAPEDIKNMTDAFEYYKNAMSLRVGKYYPPFQSTNNQPEPYVDYNFGQTGDWQIKTIDPNFNAARKTVRVSVVASRVLNPSPVKMISCAGGSAFVWEQSVISKQLSVEVESVIFSENITITGNATIPEDMTDAEASLIVSQINSLPIFSSTKYPNHKMMAKQAFYDKFSKQLNYNIQLKKLDFYDPFKADGKFVSANDINRDVDFSSGVLTGISGVQFDVNFEESVSEDENGIQISSLSVNGRLVSRADQILPGKSVQETLNQIFDKYVNRRTKISNNKYRLTNATRGINTSRMEGRFTLGFSDDGRGDRVKGNGIDWYSFFIVNPRFETEEEAPRWQIITDGVSDGQIYQHGGLSIRRISMSGLITKDYFINRHAKMKSIQSIMNQNGGRLEVGGLVGRVASLRLSGEDLVKQMANISVSIEVQPKTAKAVDPALHFK